MKLDKYLRMLMPAGASLPSLVQDDRLQVRKVVELGERARPALAIRFMGDVLGQPWQFGSWETVTLGLGRGARQYMER